jgi:hypothetical protein
MPTALDLTSQEIAAYCAAVLRRHEQEQRGLADIELDLVDVGR